MEEDQLAVARAPDVELDHVRPEVDRPLEGRQRVLGNTGAPGAAMGDHVWTVAEAAGRRFAAVRRQMRYGAARSATLRSATVTASARTRMRTRSPTFT